MRRDLENIQPAPNPAPVENLRRLGLGVDYERIVGPLPERVAAEVDALCAGTPAAAPAFAAARAVLVRKLQRLARVGEYLEAQHDGSPLTHKGGELKAARLEMDLLASVEKSLDQLGLSPMAAGKLGVDLGRGANLAEELEKARLAREQDEQRVKS